MSYRGNEPPAGKAGRDMDDSAERGDPVMPDSRALPLLFLPPKNPPKSLQTPKRIAGRLMCMFFGNAGQTWTILRQSVARRNNRVSRCIMLRPPLPL